MTKHVKNIIISITCCVGYNKVVIFLLLDKMLRVCVELITTEMRSQDHASVGTLIINLIYLYTFKSTKYY